MKGVRRLLAAVGLGICLEVVANNPSWASVNQVIDIQLNTTDVDPIDEAESIAESSFSVDGNVLADSSVPSAEETLRIVVTAEKRPEDVQDVPISITVFDEEQLEDADIISFGQIADNTPNFSFFNRGESRFFSIYSVRGISNLSFASQDAVAFFIDDVPYDFGSFLDFDLLDLERVEVLRGPQSTLYGRSSLAGVVHVISRLPSNDLEFKSSANYGSEDDTRLSGSVSVPLVPDKLFFRLSGGYASRDGYVFNTFLDEDADDQSSWTGRAQLLWTPSDEWEVLLRGSIDDYDEGISPLVLVDQDPFETQLDFDEFNEVRSNAQSLKVTYTHPDFLVSSITTRRESEQDAGIDLDYTTADARAELINYQSTVFGQELRIQSPENSDRFQWLLGGYFEAFEFEDEGGIQSGPDAAQPPGFGLPPGFEQRDGEIERETFAVFSQLDFTPVEALRLTAGLRYESNESTLEGFTRTFTDESGFLTIPLLSIDEIEQNGDELLPRFAAQYQFNPNLTAYGSISRGFRPAGVNVTPFSTETATFEAETSWNYELGLKSSWLDNSLFANLAVFYNPVNNFQFVGFQPATRTLFVGNADVDIFGAELELSANPVEGLDLIAGLGIVDAEFKDSTDPFTGNSFDGNQVPFAPRLTYNLAAQYRSPSGLFGRIELNGFGETQLDNDNSFEQDPYAIVNARLGYEIDNVGIYLFANNLFDTRYLTQVLTTPPARGAFGAPATFGLQVRSEF